MSAASSVLPHPHDGSPPSGSVVWNQRLGTLWADVFRGTGIRHDANVVELGPGHSAKIAYGLLTVGFAGGLLLVDPDEAARQSASRAYRQLLPHANIRVVPRLMGNHGALGSGKIDFLLANHVLDDLFLSSLLSSGDSDSLFGSMTPDTDCSPEFRRIWGEVLRNPELLTRTIERVVDELVRLVGAVKPSWFVINQYPSWRQTQCGLKAIHQVGQKMFTLLASRLEQTLLRTVTIERAAGSEMSWMVSAQ